MFSHINIKQNRNIQFKFWLFFFNQEDSVVKQNLKEISDSSVLGGIKLKIRQNTQSFFCNCMCTRQISSLTGRKRLAIKCNIGLSLLGNFMGNFSWETFQLKINEHDSVTWFTMVEPEFQSSPISYFFLMSLTVSPPTPLCHSFTPSSKINLS